MEFPLHPLINPASPHYDREDGKVGIEEAEKKINIQEMIGACKFNIFKYDFREKGCDEEDEIKRRTYQRYLDELLYLIAVDIDPRISVAKGWKIAHKKWRYR